MYAIVEAGGQQFRVSPGDTIEVQKLAHEGKKEISLDKVLMVSKDDRVEVGNPYLRNASVKAEVQGEGKSAKVIVYKQKPRKGHRKLNGHRQHYTMIAIKDIVFGG